MRIFLNTLNKKISEERKNSVLGVIIEIIVGFLKSLKCYSEESNKELQNICEDTLINVIKQAPSEVEI